MTLSIRLSISLYLSPTLVTQIQKIINRKLDLFDEIKDVQLLKDIAALVSATGFSQLLEACRRECGAVAKAADAALCRCSSKSAPDLDAANAFNEKSCYPWISAKASQRLAAAAEATCLEARKSRLGF